MSDSNQALWLDKPVPTFTDLLITFACPTFSSTAPKQLSLR